MINRSTGDSMLANKATQSRLIVAAFVGCTSVTLNAQVSALKPIQASTASCAEAWRIFGAAASKESAPGDVLIRAVPEFPQQVVWSQGIGPTLVRLTPESKWWRENWVGQRPSKDHILRWSSTPFRSITICLSANAVDLAIDQLPGSKSFLRESRPGESYIIEATYPVFDASRSHVLLVFSKSAKTGLGGNSRIVLLERSRRTWREVGWGLVSVS
jgi:hypothetical protein